MRATNAHSLPSQVNEELEQQKKKRPLSGMEKLSQDNPCFSGWEPLLNLMKMETRFEKEKIWVVNLDLDEETNGKEYERFPQNL